MEEGQEKGRKISRRQFISDSIKAIGSIAVTGVSLKTLDTWTKSVKTQSASGQAQASLPQNTPTVTAPTSDETIVPKTQENLTKSLSLIEQLFVNCNNDEKQKAFDVVKKEKEGLKDRGGPTQIQLENSLRWKSLIDKCAKELDYKPNSLVPKILPALIFVESRGNPNAENKNSGAKGLCQFLNNTAKETAQEIDLTGNIDLFDPETNIKLSLVYLNKLYQLFPDPSLTFWAYHLGMGNLTSAINAFTDRKDIELSQNNAPDTTHGVVREQKLNLVKLLSSDKVANRLKAKNAYNDETHLYVIKIAGAAALMEDLE